MSGRASRGVIKQRASQSTTMAENSSTTVADPASQTSSSDDSGHVPSGSNLAAIAGGTIGGMLVVVFICGFIIYGCMLRRRREPRPRHPAHTRSRRTQRASNSQLEAGGTVIRLDDLGGRRARGASNKVKLQGSRSLDEAVVADTPVYRGRVRR